MLIAFFSAPRRTSQNDVTNGHVFLTYRETA